MSIYLFIIIYFEKTILFVTFNWDFNGYNWKFRVINLIRENLKRLTDPSYGL